MVVKETVDKIVGDLLDSSNSAYGKAIKTVAHNEENLLEVLNDSSRSMLNKFSDAQLEINALTAIENFSYGFKLGVLLMVEVFTRE